MERKDPAGSRIAEKANFPSLYRGIIPLPTKLTNIFFLHKLRMRMQTDKALSRKSKYECGLVDYFQGSKLKVAGKISLEIAFGNER